MGGEEGGDMTQLLDHTVYFNPCPWVGQSQFGQLLAVWTCTSYFAGADPSSPIGVDEICPRTRGV